MKYVLYSSALLISFISLHSRALEIQFERDLQQGALVYGVTTAKRLKVLDRTIDVDESGRFVFGLGRDTKPQVKLTLIDGDKAREMSLSVSQRKYHTQSIEGIPQKYVSPPQETTQRIQTDSALIKSARANFTWDRTHYLDEFSWPAKGPISGVYGSQRIFNGVPKRPHYGLDIAAPTGAPVTAPVGGVVRLAHSDMYYSGGTLVVDHGRGVSSTFIHLSKLHVKVGDIVVQNQLIGEVGATGRATGPHLDWRINWFNQRLDPQLLLPVRD